MANTRDHELVILLNAIGTSCKLIASAVKRAGVAQLYGLAGEVNSTGDDQKKLDVMSDDMMINALVNSGVCSVLVSEEKEELLNSEMNYIISPDPQLIEKNSFGWTSSSDFGIRIVTDQLSIPFSTLYDDIIFSEKYFIALIPSEIIGTLTTI